MSRADRKFWNWIKNDAGENILRLEGPIDEDNFWGDSVTPQQFREELDAVEGDVTVWINSPGGNVFCGAEIYTMLCDHKGSITVKIDAIAASAASVIAMAGDRVLMSPVGMILIHDPMTIAMGNAADMEKAISTLNEVKESIINAYCRKTGLSRNKVSKLMSDETWMNARKAVELGFVDEILFGKDNESGGETGNDKGEEDGKEIEAVWKPYSTKAMGQRVLNWLLPANADTAGAGEEPCEPSHDEEDMEQSETGVVFDMADSEGDVSEGDPADGPDTENVIPTGSRETVLEDKKSPSRGGSDGDSGDTDGEDSRAYNPERDDSDEDDSDDEPKKDSPDNDDPDSDDDGDDIDDPDEDDLDDPNKPSPSKQKGGSADASAGSKAPADADRPMEKDIANEAGASVETGTVTEGDVDTEADTMANDTAETDTAMGAVASRSSIEDTGQAIPRPTVGYDGKTVDGAMPYELLRKQLDCLR